MTGRMDCRARRASRTLTVRRRESVRRLVPEHRPPRGGDRADRDQQRDEAARGLRARRQRTPGARRVPNRVIAGPEARQMGSRHSEIDDRDCDARDREDDETDRDRCHQATRNHGSKATDRWSSDVCARRCHAPRSGADLVVLRGELARDAARVPSRPRENRCRRSRCRSCSSRGHPWDSSRNCRSQWCRSCSSRGHPWDSSRNCRSQSCRSCSFRSRRWDNSRNRRPHRFRCRSCSSRWHRSRNPRNCRCYQPWSRVGKRPRSRSAGSRHQGSRQRVWA